MIVKATTDDAQLLSQLAATTFVQSHGHSATAEDIQSYLAEKYTVDALQKELDDLTNIYHIIYRQDLAVGYSKIVLDVACPGSNQANLTKLDRIYVLQEYYGSKAGSELFDFNIALSKEKGQAGIWLYTWTENHRAIRFYVKKGFVIVGNYFFKISATHSNPNHCLLLLY